MAKSSVVLLFSGSILGREYMEDKDCVNSWISVKIVWGSGLDRTYFFKEMEFKEGHGRLWFES